MRAYLIECSCVVGGCWWPWQLLYSPHHSTDGSQVTLLVSVREGLYSTYSTVCITCLLWVLTNVREHITTERLHTSNLQQTNKRIATIGCTYVRRTVVQAVVCHSVYGFRTKATFCVFCKFFFKWLILSCECVLRWIEWKTLQPPQYCEVQACHIMFWIPESSGLCVWSLPGWDGLFVSGSLSPMQVGMVYLMGVHSLFIAFAPGVFAAYSLHCVKFL